MSKITILGVFLTWCATSLVSAQDAVDLSVPQPQHQFLHQFVGEWETASEATIEPNQPPMKATGKMSTRMLGEFWAVSESTTEMMGTKVNAVQTIGYDPRSKKYVGTWVDSLMNHMWKYEGSVDQSGKILTLEAEGPSFTQADKLAKYRDLYEFQSKDQIHISSQMLDESGTWVTFVTGTAKRKK